MADQPDFSVNTEPTLQQLIDYLLQQAAGSDVLGPVGSAVADAIAKGNVTTSGAMVQVLLQSPEMLATLLNAAKDKLEPVIAPFIAALASTVLGVDLTPQDFKQKVDPAGGGAIGAALANLFMRAIIGGTTALEPGDEAARRMMGVSAELIVDSWGEGIIFDELLDALPFVNGVNAMAELGHQIVDALGFGRLMRVGLSPLIRTIVATPLQWQTDKTFRPTLLTASTVARQVARGRWTAAQAKEELARAGYSDDRIDALLNEQTRFLGETDVQLLALRGVWTQDEAKQYLQAAGYDQATAEAMLRVSGLREWISIETTTADNIISAYAAGRIDQATRDQLLTTIVDETARRNFYESAADARRVAAQKPLTPAEARRLAKAGILAVPDYRDALEREGYTADAVDALELELQQEIDTTAKLADLKKQQLAAKIAAATAKAKLAAQRAQEAEQKAAEAQRGSVAELETAFVRGLIPLTRFTEVLGYHYDADTVRILSALAQAKRADYVAKQQKAADKLKGGGPKVLTVASLQQAVLDNLLTLDEYRQRLASLGYDAGDVDLLGEVMADKKAAYDAAQQTRAAATKKAAAKSISLSRFETLVRRGARTMADYDQLLQSLGYDEASRAALADLLKIKIADDQKAATLRANAPPPPGGRGLTLAEMRRAVLLGVKTDHDYSTLLVQLGYSTDAQQTLMGELRDDEASAAAARQRRSTTTATTGARALPLATIARAARLGLIPVSVYQQRLVDAGYTPDDIAIEMDLLTTEMADTAAARRTAATTTVPGGGKPLTLAEVAAAVKHGVQSLDDYRAAAAAAGLAPDAVDTQVRVLGDELAATKDAKARRDAIVGKLTATSTPLALLEEQVRAGSRSIPSYVATLQQEGVAPDDAALLGSLLSGELAGGTGPARS